MTLIRHNPSLLSPPTTATATTTCLCLLRARINRTASSANHDNQHQHHHPMQHTQIRRATFIPRPRRPYTFTQLVTLSDGSTYLHRTSSPLSVLKSSKDTRNTQLWNPSSQRLMNIEADEAGRLRAFRSRFGRGWDSKRGAEIEVDAEGVEVGEEVEVLDTVVPAGTPAEGVEGGDGVVADRVEVKTDTSRKEYRPQEEVEEDNFMDLIASPEFDSGVVLGPKDKKKKGKKGKK